MMQNTILFLLLLPIFCAAFVVMTLAWVVCAYYNLCKWFVGVLFRAKESTNEKD